MPDPGRYFARLTAPARVESIRATAAFVVQASRSLKVPCAAEAAFEMAVVEALTNALKHGHGVLDDESIVCEVELEARTLVVRVLDAGPGFTLPPVSLPGVSAENVDALPEAGYGMPVIQAVFPEARTVRRDGRFGLELPLSF